MPGTPYKSLIASARLHLNAQRGSGASLTTDKFWSDDELLNIAIRGTTDLWAAVIDLAQEHYLSVNTSDVTLDASATQLSGVPADTFRVYAIEPSDTTSAGDSRDVIFYPRDYNHPDFAYARSLSASEPSSGLIIYYALHGAGAPNGAPIVRTAPLVSTAIECRFVYIPTLGVHAYTVETMNPIPGESDHALIAWIVAYAYAKIREDHSPDPSWLAVYATEKQSILTRCTPRQVQEVEYVEGVFESTR